MENWAERDNENAVAFVTMHRMPPPQADRVVASVHVAMFDAVNSIERRYQPYRLVVTTTKDTSKEAAASAAAAAVLAGLQPSDKEKVSALLEAYLAALPSTAGKANGIKVGQDVASKVLAERTRDGADAPDAYRPKTKPGVYVPTPITASSMWPNVKPFAMTSPAQFRPQPPIPLAGDEWAADYNEIKSVGGKNSAKRTPSQTEDARAMPRSSWRFRSARRDGNPVARRCPRPLARVLHRRTLLGTGLSPSPHPTGHGASHNKHPPLWGL
jgi:hypothetical protein